MKLTCLDNLSEKIEMIVQKYAALKKEKEKVDQVMIKKTQENNYLKKNIEKQIKERKIVLQRIDNLINKINTIE